MGAVLDFFIHQKKELERYKEKYGDLPGSDANSCEEVDDEEEEDDQDEEDEKDDGKEVERFGGQHRFQHREDDLEDDDDEDSPFGRDGSDTEQE